MPSALQQAGNDAQRARALRVPQQVEVEALVQLAPSQDLAGFQRGAFHFREAAKSLEISFREVPRGAYQQLRLKPDTKKMSLTSSTERPETAAP